jgi:hypothetical protein
VAEEPVQAADSSCDNVEVEGVTEGGWVQWFCSLDGNDFFAEIEEDYLRDQFNLYGLKHKFDPTRFK